MDDKWELIVNGKSEILPTNRVVTTVFALPVQVGGAWQCANQLLVVTEPISL